MTATTRWLTYSAVATRLGMTVQEVERLAERGLLERRFVGGDHYAISEQSMATYERVVDSAKEFRSRTADAVAESACRPSVGGGPEIGHEAELEYRRSKEDA